MNDQPSSSKKQYGVRWFPKTGGKCVVIVDRFDEALEAASQFMVGDGRVEIEPVIEISHNEH